MSVRGRCPGIAAATGLTVLLAGCPSPPPADQTTDVDRQRAAALRAEPVLRDAVEAPDVRVGRVLNETLGWDRTRVSAPLYVRKLDAPPPVPTPEQSERRMATVLGRLREEGWTVLWSSCVPPDTGTGTGIGDPRYDEWQWLAYGYRITGGVSYWFRLGTTAVRQGTVSLSIALLAPQHRDPADLFPERPTGLAAGATCVERPGLPAAPETEGTPLELGSRYALPHSSAQRDPLLR